VEIIYYTILKMRNDWKAVGLKQISKFKAHKKEKLKAVDDGTNCENGLPVFSKDI